jgi:hypothetical protein
LLLLNISGKAMPISGKDNIDIFTLKPNSVIIHAVMVVPIFAPRITPTDFTRGSNPAFTKLTTMTVVAEEDWMIAVINKPVRTPVNLLVVIEDKMFLIRSPATFCKDSLIIFIPNRKSPRDPTIVRKSKR